MPREPQTRRTSTALPDGPFDFGLVVSGHGWYDLEPHTWDRESLTLHTAIDGHDVVVTQAERQPKLQIQVTGHKKPTDTMMAKVRRDVRRMLRLDEDLTEFWALCKTQPRLQWVQKRGAGRLMRSPTLFEDLMKLLFTTNITWAGTRAMTKNLVQLLGTKTPSGRRSFPGPKVCAKKSLSFFKDEAKTGYRAQSCVNLSQEFANSPDRESYYLDSSIPTNERRKRLLALRGFGPYAVGQALRLTGDYEDLALDSWCHAEFKRIHNKRKTTDKMIARHYEKFGRYKGLVMWMDLTAEWHGE